MTFRTFVSIVAVASFAAQANAGFEFTPTAPLQSWSHPANQENDIKDDYGVELVYKFESDGTEPGGPFDDFYSTVAPNGTAPASSGRIDWSGTGDPGTFINATMTYLYLKGGNDNKGGKAGKGGGPGKPGSGSSGEPSSYLFELRDSTTGEWWDGKQTISWSDFWSNQGKFSHVSIFSNGIVSAPEPASYALWGAALCVGFLALRRRRSASQMTA